MTKHHRHPHHCRAIIEADWPDILRIQSEVYYDFKPESEDVMRSKASRGSATCCVALDNNSSVVAYCLAYPYAADRIASLGIMDESSVAGTDNLFLHDLAVQPASAGRGVAHALFEHVIEAAGQAGYRTMSLVAVQQAASFWTKLGFAPSTQATVNDSYGGAATFMFREL